MSLDHPRFTGTRLPVVDASGVDLLQHCRWSCGYECFHAAPNQGGRGSTFRDVLDRAISRRTVLMSTARAQRLLSHDPRRDHWPVW